jgi:hypothetical protein
MNFAVNINVGTLLVLMVIMMILYSYTKCEREFLTNMSSRYYTDLYPKFAIDVLPVTYVKRHNPCIYSKTRLIYEQPEDKDYGNFFATMDYHL